MMDNSVKIPEMPLSEIYSVLIEEYEKGGDHLSSFFRRVGEDNFKKILKDVHGSDPPDPYFDRSKEATLLRMKNRQQQCLISETNQELSKCQKENGKR